MRTRFISLAALCVAVPLLAGADEGKKAVRELELKATPDEGKVERPRVITTQAELAAAIPGETLRTRLAKEVDFAAEQLLFFSWSGSEDDNLTSEFKILCVKSKESEVVFRYTSGTSANQKTHTRLFVIPADRKTTWRVERGKSK